MSEESNDKFTRLLQRYLRGKATPEEIEFVNKYYQQFEHAPDVLEQMPPDEKALLSKDILAGIDKKIGSEDGKTGVVPFYRRKILQAAAVALLLVTFGGYWFRDQLFTFSNGPAMKHISAQPGKPLEIELADHSAIRLAPGSKLEYPAAFSGRTREVRLVGEALFSVARDEMRPFIIHAGEIDVKVLGTVFNVKAYPEDKIIETSLIEGSVKIQVRDKAGYEVTLKPNQKFVFNRAAEEEEKSAGAEPGTRPFTVGPVTTNPTTQTIAETDWASGRLTFDRQPFERIALSLERWYGVHIVFENEQVKRYKYTASFSDQPVDDILKALQLSKNFNYRKEGDMIRIY